MKRAKTMVAALLAATIITLTAAPAQAHYDPWTTHTHCNSYGCYKMCSWWDGLFGCKHGYYIFY